MGELVEVVEIGQPGVSRQLAILQQARFVTMRPAGRRRLYSLRPEPFEELEAWMRAHRQTWESRLDRLGAALGGERGTDHGSPVEPAARRGARR